MNVNDNSKSTYPCDMARRDAMSYMDVQYLRLLILHLYDHGETMQKDLQYVYTNSNRVLADRLKYMEATGLAVREYRKCKDSKHKANFWKLTVKGVYFATFYKVMRRAAQMDEYSLEPFGGPEDMQRRAFIIGPPIAGIGD